MDNSHQGLSAVIVDYITARGHEKLEKLNKDIEKLKSSANPADQLKLEGLEQKRLDEQDKFKPANWLTDAARRAGQLQLVTHAPKFLHSDAKGSGVFAPADSQISAHADGTISTSNISRPKIDVIGNAAALDVGKLLQLSHDGKALIDHIVVDDMSPLLPLAKNNEQATQWLAGLKLAISSEKQSSHKLAKQIYWPTDDNEVQTYHLLAPLFATSLQQSLYQTIQSCNFSDTAKLAKEAKKTKKPSDIGVVGFPGIAEQHFGGTKPQNISQLNSQRYGKSFLLNAAPPHWQTIAKPPLKVTTIFDSIMNHKAGKLASSLRYYLEAKINRPSDLKIRDERGERVDQIIDLLFSYIGEVHQFDPGWSASDDCQLPVAEQLLLDPQRRAKDKEFTVAWDRKDWPDEIAASFSRWLNRHIDGIKSKSNQLATGKVEFVEWRTLIAQKLRILKDDFRDFYIDDEQEQGQ